MDIFRTLMTSKDSSAYTRLITLLGSRSEINLLSETQNLILADVSQQQWAEALKHFSDPVCLLCPATLTRITQALEQLKLTEMAFQVSSLCKRLVQAIEGTGDGTEARPYIILNPTAAEMWLRDMKKTNIGAATQIQRSQHWLLSVPLGTTQAWFDVTAFVLATTGHQDQIAREPQIELKTPQPLAPPAPGLIKSKAPTPGTIPVFRPTETRFGARKPGSRPTLTNITTPSATASEREPERTPDPLPNDPLIQAIRQRLGEPDTILKGMEHSPPSVELHHYKPARRRDFHTLLTVGMSSLPMHVPEGQEGYRYAELMLLLPPDWSINRNSLTDEKLGWPMFWQMKMARYVHETRTWYHHLHNFGVVSVGQTLHPATKFSHWMLVRPETMGTVMDRLTLPDGRMVHFYAMTAIYFEENEFKMREVRGGEALWERMRAANFTDILFPSRKNVIANRPSKTVEFPHP